MLNESETEALSAMVEAYGLKGVVDGLATIANRRADRHDAEGNIGRAVAWGVDARVLQLLVCRLQTGGGRGNA